MEAYLSSNDPNVPAAGKPRALAVWWNGLLGAVPAVRRHR